MTTDFSKWSLILLAIAVLTVGIFLSLTLREYFQNKNDIEARDATAKCLSQMKQSDLSWDWCLDIRNFKSAPKAKY